MKISALNEVSTGKDEEEDVTTITKEAQVRINFNHFASKHNLKVNVRKTLFLDQSYKSFRYF